MPRTDEPFPIIHRTDTISCLVEKPAKVVPLCENAEKAKWLLEQTDHKVVYDEMRETFERGIVPGSTIQELLQTIMNEWVCSLAWEGDLDRIIIGDKQYYELLKSLPPWHSFAIRHRTPIHMPVKGRDFFENTGDRFDSHGGESFVSRLVDVDIQVLPNVDGILFVPRMRF